MVLSPKQGFRHFVIPSLFSLAASFGLQPLFAQDNSEDLGNISLPSIPRALCFGMSDISEPRALQICDALSLRQTVKARELAENWVREEPQLAAAQFAFSEVLFTIEGNMARALYHLNEAERLTGYRSLPDALESGNFQWHYLTLSQLSYVHQLMGDQIKSLDYLDLINEIYGQDVESFKGWPLIKLKDFEGARASANRVLESDANARAKARAWNTLCAADLASLAPIESMDACDRAISEDESNGDGDTVYLSNAAEVSLSLLRIDEAEAYLDRATRYLNPDSVADPWIYKLYLTMNQGRFDDARTALDRMLVWREQQEPIVSAMNRAEHFLVSAGFLLLAGYTEDAIKLTSTALNQPDRNGSYSADDSQKDSYAALVNMMANQAQYEVTMERRATMGWDEWVRSSFTALSLQLDAWRAERRAAALFASLETLQNRLRPYAPLDVHIPEWIEPEIVRLIGTGVMSNILEQAKDKGAFQLNEGYYHAYQTEIAALDGNSNSTLEAGNRALSLLPQQEVLLRARVTARIAGAALAESKVDEAIQLFEIAYQLDPSIIRRLKTSLPVQLKTDNSALAQQIQAFVLNSPRFTRHSNGLVIEVSSAPFPSLCLKRKSGESLSCYTGEVGNDLDIHEKAKQIVDDFHTQTFGLGYDISKAKRSMLLGSSVILSSQNDSNLQQNRDAVLNP
ncbi:MAG: tetratricopeptide repeat protein [Pseudohongiellaceae bacterium]